MSSARYDGPNVYLIERRIYLIRGQIYFLVERPEGSGRGIHWRSGSQRLFGPFTSADFPSKLAMD